MPRVSEISEDGGEPTLKLIFDKQRELFGDVLNPTRVQEEIIPWADSKAEMNIAFLQPAHAAVIAFR